MELKIVPPRRAAQRILGGAYLSDTAPALRAGHAQLLHKLKVLQQRIITPTPPAISARSNNRKPVSLVRLTGH
jgi:hypothetical protein